LALQLDGEKKKDFLSPHKVNFWDQCDESLFCFSLADRIGSGVLLLPLLETFMVCPLFALRDEV